MATKHTKKTTKRPPVTTPEAQENRMISLAVDLAERQLIEGTASTQVICHYLKLASSREKIEQDILNEKKTLIEAKTESLQSTKRIEELYSEALSAMKKYSGEEDEEE